MTEISDEVKEKILKFHERINEIEESMSSHKSSTELSPSTPSLEMARADLATAYAASSLLWTYLSTKGHSPASNEALKAELERIQAYMKRLKEIEDKALAPKLNRNFAKAAVRNAMFDPAEQASSSQNDSSG